MLPQPQPLGIYPLPAGYLVLPPSAATATILPQLLRGELPTEWPPSLQFYAQALSGDVEAALAALPVDDSPITAYNRFVLQGDAQTYADLRPQVNGELAVLLDVVAYTLGYIATPPDDHALIGMEGVVLAAALAAQATAHLEQHNPAAALPCLEQAIAVVRPLSPLLTGQLLGALADADTQSQGVTPQNLQRYQEAIRLLAPAALAEARAELWLNLGIQYQELAQGRRSALLEAVKCYQEALRILTLARQPEAYALAQSNLALAYLAMPLQEASDQLRMAIAVQALREALKVYTREQYPEQWASAQLNLANALQYLPSSHPQENLIEAVELYEQILDVRSRETEPLGYARLLANQGNALAHLGIFVHAKPKLQEAVRIFTAYADTDAAMSLRALLSQIESQEQAQREATRHGTVRTPAI